MGKPLNLTGENIEDCLNKIVDWAVEGYGHERTLESMIPLFAHFIEQALEGNLHAFKGPINPMDN